VNNNNRGPNRRRGRNNNNNRNNGGNRGGVDSGNRIDNRARGNANQLLEKYKKLAHDAQMAGDRVNHEYYLQFADHYFRVLADNKARQDEARAKREEERPRRNADDQDDDDRDNNARNDDDDRGNDGGSDSNQGAANDEQDQDDQPRRRPRARRKPADDDKPRGRSNKSADKSDSADTLDANVLPPSISSDCAAEEEKPKPKKRAPRKRKPAGDDGADSAVAAE
jgi:hypothetical protein